MGGVIDSLNEFNKEANETLDDVNTINKNTNEIKETLSWYRDRYQYAESKGGSFSDKFWNFAEGEKKN
jgi:hypothetical protein